MSAPDSIPVASGSGVISFPALWAYIVPALDHVMRSPSENGEAPALDVNYYMGVYTMIYNFATTSRIENTLRSANSNSLMSHFGFAFPPASVDFVSSAGELALPSPSQVSKSLGAERAERVKSMVGFELYVHLEEYFQDVAKEIRSKIPNDDSELLDYYLEAIPVFPWRRYHKPPDGFKEEEGNRVTGRQKEEVLKHWGFSGGSPEQKRFAESCAEAHSSSDKIIPIASLAHRCWRLEVIEPLLISSKTPVETPPTTTTGSVLDYAFSQPSPSHSDEVVAQLKGLTLNVPRSTQSRPSVPSHLTPRFAKRRTKRKNTKGKGRVTVKTDNGAEDDDASDDISPGPSPSTPASSTLQAPTLSRSSSASLLWSSVPPSPSISTDSSKDRLNRIVGELILVPPHSPEGVSAREKAMTLSKSLKISGIGPDNAIRKRLDKYLMR
ncbi:uncharacterized protein EI90DRAFT_3149706 [Cantharellus anzutake]|uniref:uncharacterized protein n=1 Tax=Cantharellus anzutake TaxID=1750568 RepID=UPI001906C5F2|nr:uncharacterized protein EI90DRAFT_3149706 [Cantharellus anzutake]KAF8342578.1 hypothetical protein EI90DRAFT_3149706 [Cantharellus anzutake]